VLSVNFDIAARLLAETFEACRGAIWPMKVRQSLSLNQRHLTSPAASK
jgi:hypothetical protein